MCGLGLCGVLVGCSQLGFNYQLQVKPTPTTPVQKIEVVTDETPLDRPLSMSEKFGKMELLSGTEKIWLAGSGNYERYSGSAMIVRSGGTMQVMAFAELPELEGEAAYEAWLVQRKPIFSYFTIGRLQKQADGRFWLEFTGLGEFETFTEMLISVELNDDQELEKQVLQGSAL